MAEDYNCNSAGNKKENVGSFVQESVEPDVNTDGRAPYDWESKYPERARSEIKREAIYIGIVLFISFAFVICIWCGLVDFVGNCLKMELEKIASLEGIALYFASGLLGGTIFGLKYFYRVVARGFWSQDRKYWRIFSPWISACIALVVGCMVISGYINASHSPSPAAGVCVGFITGYFADEAVGKMSEVATALFGSNRQVEVNKQVDSNTDKK